MKTFFKVDNWIQQVVFTIMVFYIFIRFHQDDFGEEIFYFYYAVGGFQLVSYLTRFVLHYKKSTIYKIYGAMIIPVWLIIFSLGILSSENIFIFDLGILGGFLSTILYLSMFYSPILSVFYIFDCQKTIRKFSN